jgi:lipid A 3-O-deacylase
MIRKIGAAAGAGVPFAVFFFLAGSAHAVDGIAVEVGYGDDRTSLIRFSITDNWRKREPATREWRVAGYWEFSAGLWDNKEESTAEIAVTPVFRLERSRLYVEAAIGAHLVQAHISAHRTFSTALQFGEHLGMGMRFGQGERFDLGIRVQHLSNGGISKPNPGIDFFLVRLQRDLE